MFDNYTDNFKIDFDTNLAVEFLCVSNKSVLTKINKILLVGLFEVELFKYFC